jgi:hypothetical protein
MEPASEQAFTKAALLRRRATDTPTWIVTSGDSMGRAIVGGERVLVAAGDVPRRGEIWAFVDEHGQLVVHRFRSAADGLMWFCGDRNPVDDLPVPSAAVIGRVTAIDRGNREHRVGLAARLFGHARLDVDSIRRELVKTLRKLR